MADGCGAFLCTCRISLVFTLAAAVPKVYLDAATHRLERKYSAYVRRLASAHAWPSVGSSRLDHAVGVRICGNGSSISGVAAVCATSRAQVLNGLSHSEYHFDAPPTD